LEDLPVALATVPVAIPQTIGSPVAVRMIGILDRPLVESFADASSGMLVTGPRTLVVNLVDAHAVRDESFRRFVALLEGYRVAGHDIRLHLNAAWRKLLRTHRAFFSEADPDVHRATRRQIIIAQTTERRAGR